jgi:prepilin-type N-terminal cleavage/methylation domain-containing protein
MTMGNLFMIIEKKFRYEEKGFTLLELLVIISVLGILAAVTIPNVTKFINVGDVSTAKAELSSVRTGVNAAMADAGTAICGGGSLTSTTLAEDNRGSGGYVKGGYPIGNYIANGVTKLKGTYSIATNGTVTISAYEGLTLPSDYSSW